MKHVERTATMAWGPTEASAHYIAAGSVAGTLDFTFETTAALELFEWKPGAASVELPLVGATQAPDRFQSLAWGSQGPSGMGLLAGGLTNGEVSVWNPASILGAQGGVAPLTSMPKHGGAVQGLDWNPTMTNLLASCGADGQLLVWDLAGVGGEKPLNVYSPGPRVKPLQEGITCVAWNKSPAVPHILAGQLSSGPCEIWDLKNKKQVITFHDAKRSTRGGQRSLAWHPTEPTMIIQACDDDASPVALVWDLKHYAAPVAVLSAHSRGVVCVSWSGPDLSLALTSSRDGSSILWDVATATPRSHLCPVNDKAHHVQTAWAPRVKAHLASASSDGFIRVHSVVDPGPKGRVASAAALGPAPTWLRRPCGASFGFGGRLLKFNSALGRSVQIQPIITDPELVDNARKLQAQTESPAQLLQLCEERAASLPPADARVWQLLALRLRGVERPSALLSVLGLAASTEADSAPMPPTPAVSMEDAGLLFEALGRGEHQLDPAPAAAPESPPLLWGETAWEHEAGRLACLGDVRGAWRVCGRAGQWATAFFMAKELGGDSEYALCKEAWLKTDSKTESVPAIARGLVPLLAEHSDRLVAAAPLQQWEALAAAALSWGEDAAARLSTLAHRLSALGNTSAAQICLIGAEDVDGLADLWTRSTTTTEAVLRLLCASHAFGATRAPSTSGLANYLAVLADSLAAQGDMKGALHWLQLIDNPARAPVHIRLLYERLHASTTPKTTAPATAAPKQQQQQQQQPVHHLLHHQHHHPAVAPVPLVQPRAGFVAPPVPVASVVPATYAASAPAPRLPVPAVPMAVPMPMPVPVPVPQPQPHRQVPVASVPVAPTTAVHPVAPAVVVPPPALMPMATAAAHVAPVAAPVSNPAVAVAFDRLLATVSELGNESERATKVSVEVSKRLPAMRSKLETMPAAQTDAVVGLLEAFTNALASRDATQAQAIYTEAQQGSHQQVLGSTGTLALKRCLDLVRK